MARSATSTAADSETVTDVRILHLAWEYPPLVYGGLGRHVGALATAQARAGHEVVVITQTEDEAVDEIVSGVRVIRVRRDPSDIPFSERTLLAWVAGLERSLTRAVVALAGPKVIGAVGPRLALEGAIVAIGCDMRGVVALEPVSRGGQCRGELTVVISADEAEPRAFADIQREPAQLGVQSGRVHGAVHDVAEDHDFVRLIAIDESD